MYLTVLTTSPKRFALMAIAMKYYILHALIQRHYRGTFKRWRFDEFSERIHEIVFANFRTEIRLIWPEIVSSSMQRYPKIRHDSNLAKTAQRRFHMSRKCDVHVNPVTFDVYSFETFSRSLNIRGMKWTLVRSIWKSWNMKILYIKEFFSHSDYAIFAILLLRNEWRMQFWNFKLKIT